MCINQYKRVKRTNHCASTLFSDLLLTFQENKQNMSYALFFVEPYFYGPVIWITILNPTLVTLHHHELLLEIYIFNLIGEIQTLFFCIYPQGCHMYFSCKTKVDWYPSTSVLFESLCAHFNILSYLFLQFVTSKLPCVK